MVIVKICGITNLADARVATEAGADLIGFVFAPSSPRYTSPVEARNIIEAWDVERASEAERAIGGSGPKVAGVFVNERIERVQEIAANVGLDFIQLHGDEPPEYVQALGLRAYKALRPRTIQEARARMLEYSSAAEGRCPAFIVDAFNESKYGGTGERADRAAGSEIASRFPILLAGGLNVENVGQAIACVRPWGVDVSSGVEESLRKKDHVKVREFIRKAKGY